MELAKNVLGSGRIVNFTTAAQIAARWREGASAEDLNTEFGGTNIVTSARRLLGEVTVPKRLCGGIRNGVPRKPHVRTTLITSADLGRHRVRRLNAEEYIVRDSAMREELWRKDKNGIVFGPVRLAFVIVMGMTERRVPHDLQHIYPQ